VNGAWWAGTRLVFERGLLEKVRSKTFRIVTALLLVVSVGAVVAQSLANETTTYTLATVGLASPDVVAGLDAAAETGEFEVRYVTRDSEEGLREAVRVGEATVGLAGERLYVAGRDAGTFPGVVAQAVVALETSRVLAEAGLSEEQLGALGSIRPPEQVTVTAVEDEGRAGVGFAVGLVLYLALLFGGSQIATVVATEKSTRISEVLLTVLRPSQVLVGTVLAVGTVTLLQLLVLATPAAIAVRVSDRLGLPSVASTDLVLAVVWFLLGFALYAFLYAAGGALVDKVTEVDTAVAPIVVVILGAYFASLALVMDDPDSTWSLLVSIFPATAPIAMPLRWSSGDVPTYQLLLAMLLTAAAAVALVSVVSTTYRRALLITGHRVRLREVVGGAP
jgi:ABC-2 type transport system permease protein